MNISAKAAKEQFDDLLARAEAGERVVVTRDGTPIAEIVPISPTGSGKSLLGALKGKIRISDDFDEPDDIWGDLLT